MCWDFKFNCIDSWSLYSYLLLIPFGYQFILSIPINSLLHILFMFLLFFLFFFLLFFIYLFFFCFLVTPINQFLIILWRCTLYTPVCLQDEPTCMRIEPVYGSLTCTGDDCPCTGGPQLTSRSEGRRTSSCHSCKYHSMFKIHFSIDSIFRSVFHSGF